MVISVHLNIFWLTIMFLYSSLFSKRMNKSMKITVIVLAILIALYPFNYNPINQALNSIREVNKNCQSDEDCKISATDCPLCDLYAVGDAANTNYEPLCPLPDPYFMNCTQQESPLKTDFEAECINNECKKKAKNIHINLLKHPIEYWAYIILF